MDEILKKLLESELLTEETRTEIASQWKTLTEAHMAQVREETEAAVRAELVTEWVNARDKLIEQVDGFVAEALTREITELRADIDRFRDLEAEKAAEIVAEKARLAKAVSEELDELVEKIDKFFEMRLAAEFEELKEDLAAARENDFGRQIFEAFASTFASTHIDEKSVSSKLTAATKELAAAKAKLAEAEAREASLIRESKLEKLLAPLSGSRREQMAMLLKATETSRLDESYKHFIGRILQEPAAPAATALTEGATGSKTTVVTGEAAPVESTEAKLDEGMARLQRLAGL
jgi:hypothetical protein